MPAKKIRFVLELLLMLLAVCASWLFPRLGVLNQLAQTIAFTASMSLALIFLIRKWRLPRTATIHEQSGASAIVLACFALALLALERADTRLPNYGGLTFLLFLIPIILMLWERFALRRRLNA